MAISNPRQIWTVILAGGEGTRLRRLTRALHGEDRPKQFAFIHGGRSLLQSTLARSKRWSAPDRSVVVVAREREAMARSQLPERSTVDVVAQPANCGTGPGVLLPLARVIGRDPEALVVILPSDHYVRDEAAFERSITHALEVACAQQSVVLIGAVPDSAETQYGWIAGEVSPGGQYRVISGFWEKPAPERARGLFATGALWNTFVMVGSARQFWQLARLHLPQQTQRFEAYLGAVDTPCELPALEQAYRAMPHADFSSDLLQRAQGLCAVPLEACGWSDWGTPERVLESLRHDRAFHALHQQLEAAERRSVLESLPTAALIC
jgi:mannose-1-phosphate guanylyltransferase